MSSSFYIPINSQSLAHYFGRAIILPAKYYNNRPEDIQNGFESSLLISHNRWTATSDCSIEIILTEKEISQILPLSDSYFEIHFPIPISRVKKIYFQEKNQKDTTVWNINNSAAFIPEGMAVVDTNVNPAEAPFSTKGAKATNEFSDKVKRFDIILGGFAFMKIGRRGDAEYPDNYFSTLSFFNKLIEEQYSALSKHLNLSFSTRYNGLFSRAESEWTKWLPVIFHDVTDREIDFLAQSEGIRYQRKLGFINLESINPSSHLYEVAVLAIYGERKTKSTEDLISDITSGFIPKQKAETIALIFGLNNGYSRFRNKYKIGQEQLPVKFKLETKLDYYTIESIYQFVFNKISANYSFPYLDEVTDFPKVVARAGYHSFEILNTEVVFGRKRSLAESLWEEYSKDMVRAIVNSNRTWIPPFAKYNEAEAVEYFKGILKSPFIHALESYSKKLEANFEDKLKIQKQNLESEFARILENVKQEQTQVPTEKSHTPEQHLVQTETTTKDKEDKTNTTVSATVDYSKSTLVELKKIAKNLGINVNKKSKEDIVKLIENNLTLL